ncbi:slc38a7 [Symbiodinium pilosum]|uniref:Slc38a7 protein n=1 Tax=Symbiodinium pilosum TaxID=2952 RepID=A0A812L0H6_SYMPI|nr:slc38a7 [Symbiodinium pilosum]
MSLGVGVFSLPTTMNAVGWVLGVGLCCYFGVLSMALMLLLLGVVEERNIRSWEDLTGLAPVACSLSRVSLLLSLLIGNAAHMQTISGMLFDLMTYFVTDDYGEYHFGVWQRVTLLFIFLGVASPFCFTEDLAALHYVGKSVAGVVLLLCAAVAVSSCIMLARGEEVHSDQATPPVSGDLQVLLSTAPSVCFAFTGMLSFWEVFAALKQGVGVEQALPRMKKTVILSAGLVLVVYLIVSGCCVLAFGQMAGKMHKGSGFGNVLYNFPMDNYPVTLLCAALVVVIVLEYPVINFPLVSTCVCT